MPFRAFGDSDEQDAFEKDIDLGAFQCPFGHSGILTCWLYEGFEDSDDQVSMPFRAFGDSD